MKVDFATFCYWGDARRLHHPGQLYNQIISNVYDFDNIFVVYQNCHPNDYNAFNVKTVPLIIEDIDSILKNFGVNIDKPQYVSGTDNHHTWKQHVVNHVRAIQESQADYIVFADNDCWIIQQPRSWVTVGIAMLESNPDLFIVSPNDGEPERITSRFSQQMFLVSVDKFKQMDFNQPGWDGNAHVEGGPIPEYWGMLEGRMDLYCKYIHKFRYVLSPEYRYWHHNRLNNEGHFETDYSKY